MINQSIISGRFGAGEAMDAYFATLALPVLITNLVVNALQSSTIPVFIRMRAEGRDREASEVLSTMLNFVLLLTGLFTAVTLLFPRLAVEAMAPGVSAATINIGVQLTPWIFPILLFNTVIGFLTGIANATRRFGVPSFSAMLVPVGIFIGTVFLGGLFGVTALAMGLMGGTVLQFLLMLLFTRNLQMRYRPFLYLRHPEVLTTVGQFWPMLIGASIGQANPVVDQIVASLLGSGSISTLNYALKVSSIPISVIIIANSQAIYPFLSSQAAARDYKSLKATLGLFIWLVGGIVLAISLVFIVFSGLIVNILFRHGAFTARDAHVTSLAVIGFSVGLLPVTIEYMLTRTYNALQRNRTLLLIAVFTLFMNAALDIIFANIFGLPGIALGTSADYVLIVVLQIGFLRGQLGPLGWLTPPPALIKTVKTLGGKVGDVVNLESLGNTFGRTLRNALLLLVGFAGLVALTIYDTVQALRVSVGLALAFVFVSNPYLLLLAWGSLGVFYGVYVLGHSLGYVLALGSLPAFILMVVRWLVGRKRWPLGISAYLLFLAWILVGMQRSPLSTSQFAIDVLGFFDYGLMFLLLIEQLSTWKRLESFVTAILCSTTAVSLLGILQYGLRFGGFQEPGSRYIYRVSGLYGWSNSFGFLLVLVLPFCLYRLLTTPRSRRLLWSMVLLAHVLALALTFVRTAYIATIVMVAVAAIFLNRSIRRWLLGGLLAVAVVGGILVAIPGLDFRQRLLQNLATLNARTVAWQALLTHLHLSDPLGQGLFASSALLTRLHVDNVTAPHSLFLQVLFDHGYVGLFLLVVTFVLLLVGAVRRVRHLQGRARILLALTIGGLVGGIVYVSVDNTFWVYALGTYFWILAAIPYAHLFERPTASPTSTPAALPGEEASPGDQIVPIHVDAKA